MVAEAYNAITGVGVGVRQDNLQFEASLDYIARLCHKIRKRIVLAVQIS